MGAYCRSNFLLFRIRCMRCSMVFWCMVFMRFLVLGLGIGSLFIYLLLNSSDCR